MGLPREEAVAFIASAREAAMSRLVTRGEGGQILAVIAQTLATLELAEQQRIANLIALAGLDASYPPASDNGDKARAELAKHHIRDVLDY